MNLMMRSKTGRCLRLAKLVAGRGTPAGISALFVLIALLAWIPAVFAEEPPPATQEATSDFKKVAPITAANLRGHESLYNEGWFIVSSTRDTLAYAYKHSVTTSGEALNEALTDIKSEGGELAEGVKAGASSGVKRAKGIHNQGKRFSQYIKGYTDSLGEAQIDYGLKSLGEAWGFVKGGIYYGKRTETHWKDLKQTWPDYYGDLKQDFSNVNEINQSIAGVFATKMEADWDGAFEQAAQDFQEEYEKSGERGNSLMALGDILSGYLKTLYQGLVKPSARTLAVVGMEGARGASYIFTPAADSVLVAGRTLQATGLSIYYATRTTVEVFSPTVEAGFLTALGLLSIGSGTATYLGGQGLGMANQVAFSSAGAVTGVAEGAGRGAMEAGKYVALVSYDIGKGATKVMFNQARSAVALGYNAITAIPTHLILGVPNAAIFLAYEGPKLILVRVSGDFTAPNDAKKTNKHQITDLPVGTVVDLEELKKMKNLKVETLSDDPEVTLPVLEKLSEDFKQSEGE